MLPIFWGIIATACGSFSTPPLKKALSLGKNIPDSFIKLFAALSGIIIFTILVYFLGFEKQILSDINSIIMILGVTILGVCSNLIQIYTYKNTKLSLLLPYGNIDKLFIIIFGFFLYQSIPGKETSITTLIITIATLIIIGIFTIDFKQIQISKGIGIWITSKLLGAIQVILLGYILIYYSTFSYGLIHNILKAILLLGIGLYLQNKLTALFKQSKKFYKYRFSAIAMGQTSIIIGLLLIENLGVIIASLLGFLSIVFNIISMKLILNDSPSKKQIILAFIVITMIGLGYYFK